MKSPTQAILWEAWRVTRAEAAWKLAVGIIGGLAVLALCAALAPADNPKMSQDIQDNGAAIAMTLLVLPHLVVWLSPAKLNGGRPGFPLYLHYTRPVRTTVIVGLPMVYLTAMSTAIYLVSALVLRLASGHAFPLLPVAGWVAAFTVVGVAAAWSTRIVAVPVLVMTFAIVKALGLAMDRLTSVELPDGFDWPPRLWPTLFDFPLTDYALIAAIGLVSFVVAVAGVGRQRHGGPAVSPSVQRNGLRDWLVSLFRIPCPTASATRAQAWLDLKYSGFPLLTIAVTLAIVILLLSAVGGPIDAVFAEEIRKSLSCTNPDCFYARPIPVLFAPVAVGIVLFLGGNAFGIRRRQGRTYFNALEATQAYGTAQLAALKVLVKSACLMAALVVVGLSIWLSLPLLDDAVFIQMWNVPLSSKLRAINGDVAALTGYEQLSLVVVAVIGVVVWVAAFAALGALRARYSRRVNIAASSLLLSGLALALLALAEHNGIVSASVMDMTILAIRWIAGAAAVLVTVYLFWSGFMERLLTVSYALTALVISAAFAAAWVTVLHAGGTQSPTNISSILAPLILLLMASALAPWSFSRIRHL